MNWSDDETGYMHHWYMYCSSNKLTNEHANIYMMTDAIGLMEIMIKYGGNRGISGPGSESGA